VKQAVLKIILHPGEGDFFGLGKEKEGAGWRAEVTYENNGTCATKGIKRWTFTP
jgi:hypothetical protein